MKKLLLIVLILVMLFSLSMVALAQEEEGGELNWCLMEGHPWNDGRCANEDFDVAMWYYACGWYMAHAEAGLIDMYGVPCWCAMIMPNKDGDPADIFGWYDPIWDMVWINAGGPDHVDFSPSTYGWMWEDMWNADAFWLDRFFLWWDACFALGAG